MGAKLCWRDDPYEMCSTGWTVCLCASERSAEDIWKFRLSQSSRKEDSRNRSLLLV